MPVPSEFGSWLKYVRAQKGWTQAELQESLRISGHLEDIGWMIKAYELGPRVPTENDVRIIAEVLQTDIEVGLVAAGYRSGKVVLTTVANNNNQASILSRSERAQPVDHEALANTILSAENPTALLRLVSLRYTTTTQPVDPAFLTWVAGKMSRDELLKLTALSITALERVYDQLSVA